MSIRGESSNRGGTTPDVVPNAKRSATKLVCYDLHQDQVARTATLRKGIRELRLAIQKIT
jgi:hypothetical protein